jgi:hypothetical protein
MATYTAPTTRTSGDLITASIWNTDLVENLKYFKDSPNFAGNPSIGDGTTTRSLTVNGASSGASGGASVLVQNGSTTLLGLGNKSAILGGAYDGAGYVYGATSLELGTAGSTRMTLDGSGNVGVGKSPSYKFDVSGTMNATRSLSAVATLTDGASVALDASLGNVFTLSASGNRTISAPTNAVSGQRIIIAHTASGGARTLSLTTGSSGAFRFGTDITALTATGSGLTDYIGCVYNSGAARWDVVAVVKGY